MDVGIYGPLAGYIASALAVAAGFALSVQTPIGAPAAIAAAFGGEPLANQAAPFPAAAIGIL